MVLYVESGDLAPEIGVGEVLAQLASYSEYPYEVGYLWCGRWGWLDTIWLAGRSKLPGGSWRKVITLLRRAFRR